MKKGRMITFMELTLNNNFLTLTNEELAIVDGGISGTDAALVGIGATCIIASAVLCAPAVIAAIGASATTASTMSTVALYGGIASTSLGAIDSWTH